MTTDRSERNRELIEKSATLLAADYPLDVIIERLCNTVATVMEATVFVALPKEDGTMRLSYATQRGQRRETHDQLMPEGSRVANVFHSARPLVLRDAADWDGEEPYEITGPGDERLPMRSALYVPVVYGDAVLAVLSVARPDEEQFDRDDVRVIESIARHLAVAIRNQRSLQYASTPSRYPWVRVAAITVITIAALLLVSFWTKERYDALRTDLSNQRSARAAAMADRVARGFRQDLHLVDVGAAVVGPVRGNAALARSLVVRLVASREDRADFGMGIFYEPGVFTSGTFAVFAQAQTGKSLSFTSGYPYTTFAWYRRAIAARGAPVISGPFRLGRYSYISTERAFFSNHRMAGVVTVDKRASDVVTELQALLHPNERAAIVDANGTVILGAGGMPQRERAVTPQPLGIAGWTLQLFDSNEQFSTQARSILLTGIALDIAIALGGILLITSLHGAARARHLAVGLQRQRAELQQEIATRIDAEERLRAAAYHDALTGLPNRTFFLDQLNDVTSQRERGTLEYAVLFIDLDRFHVINDSMGHSAGDELLRAIAVRLQETVPPHALVARLGGDEFVLLLPSPGPVVQEALAISEDILQALRNPFVVGDRELYSGASIGIVKIDAGYTEAETVLRDADISMYHAKRGGRARFAVFDQEMRERSSRGMLLEGALRGAIERREIQAHYQPILRLSDETIVGFEMLARWRYNDAYVPAADFISIAEQTGMLRAIDAELFGEACRNAVDMARIAPGIVFSVNVSANDLTRASLLADVDATMELYSVPPSLLRLEITETAVMSDAERALDMLHELRIRGLQLVVDDFGAGYSSLSYLQRLPIAGVKIDRSFIEQLPGEPQSLEIVRAIVALAKALTLSTTAEGVETAEQAQLLRDLGVDYAQGFYYSPAVPFEEAKSLFAVRVE